MKSQNKGFFNTPLTFTESVSLISNPNLYPIITPAQTVTKAYVTHKAIG